MTQELKQFQSRPYAATTPYDLEFSGRAVSTIGVRFAAQLTGSPATVRDDAAFRLLGTPEVNQAENPLIRMSGPTWRHLSAMIDGGYDKYAAGTTASTPGQILAMAMIDLARLMPGSLINAADKKVFLRGEFAALSVYSATPPTTVSGTLRPLALSSQANASQGFLRPKFSEADVLLVSPQEDQQHPLRFEQETYLLGILVQQLDTSAANQRVDGIVRSLRIDQTSQVEGQREIARATWGQARTYTQYRAGFNQEDYDRSTGVVFIPTRDLANPRANFARLFNPGDSLTVHIDTNATVEEEFTAITAANDTLRLTFIAFTPVAGSGDAVAQIAQGTGLAASAVRAQARSAKRALRART